MPDVEVLWTRTELASYLADTEYVDWHATNILVQAAELKAHAATEVDVVRRIYEWVRDEIPHSCDIQDRRVTARASEVLQERVGICYGKSHLLAALMRAVGNPAGFSYQRLTLLDDPTGGYAIHALNTIWLSSLGCWIRVDARGNRPGIDAQFSLDHEQLAFRVRPQLGEIDYAVNLSEPHPAIIATLTSHTDALLMCQTSLPSALEFSSR
jgi:transglutaminase-like putative cysteine protease